MILNTAGATEIKPDTPENREIFRMVENVALAAGLPTPYIISVKPVNNGSFDVIFSKKHTS
jgi:hypothetical protein